MLLKEVAEKPYHVFDVEWSQTDKDTYIVQADSKETAKKLLEDKFPGARYVNLVRSHAIVFRT